MSELARRYVTNRFALWAAIAFALAACWPEFALRPVASLVSQMRRPEQAVPVARAFFACAVAASIVIALWWSAILNVIARALAALAAMPSRRFWLVAAALALAPRVLALLLPYEPTSDAAWYDDVARSLARGEGLVHGGHPTAFRSPGYPYVLSLLYRFAGERLALAWWLGAIATGVLLASVYNVAARLHGITVARTAVLLAAVYPALVLMTGQSMSDLLFTAGMFAATSLALAMNGRRLRDAAIFGAAAGALTLVRTAGIGLFALGPAIWWLRDRDGRGLLRNVVIAGCTCGALLTPWMLRNAEALGRFTIGTNGGSNLLVGSRTGASGMRDSFEISPATASACVRGTEVDCDDAMWAEAMQFVSSHPVEALSIVPRKFVGMYLLETAAVTSLFQGEHPAPDAIRHMLYAASQLAWMAIAALVLARIVSWRDASLRPAGAQWAGWLCVAYFTAICLVFFGTDRYKLPVVPWFLIEAGVALGWLVQPRRRSINPLSSSSDAN